ncbi:MAG: PAS domain S-box protein, partial [Leptospiraceae bacterium]|nr:PAS domain S-box protein [Leptospiraceae bacterium]
MLTRTAVFLLSFGYLVDGIFVRIFEDELESDLPLRLLFLVVGLVLGFYLKTDKRDLKLKLEKLAFLFFLVLTHHSIYKCYKTNFDSRSIAISFSVFLIVSNSLYNRILLYTYLAFCLVGNLAASAMTLKSSQFFSYIGVLIISYTGSFWILLKKIAKNEFFQLSNEEVEQLVENQKEGLIITNENLEMQYFNEYAKKYLNLGFDEEFLIGSKILLPVPVLEQKLSNNYEVELKGGIHLETKYIKTEYLGELHYSILLKDITDDVKRKQKEKERFFFQEEILKNLPEGVVYLDTEGIVKYVNPETLKLLELEMEELMGEFFLEKIHSTTAEGTSIEEENFPMRVTYTEGTPCHVTFDLFWRKDGSFFFVEYKANPVYDQNGKLLGAILLFRDVTKRKQKEDTDKRYADELLLLSNISTKLLEIFTENELYKFIAKQTSELSQNSLVIVNSFDSISEVFRTRAFYGFEKYMSEIYKLLGKDLRDIIYKVGKENLQAYNINRVDMITELPQGLFSLQYGNWSYKICTDFQRILECKKVYVIGLSYSEIFLGNIIILLQKEYLESKSTLEIFANQASVSLYRRTLDKSLLANSFRFDPLIQETSAVYVEMRLDGTILFINPKLETVSGYSKEEVYGENWWSIFQTGMEYMEIQDFLKNIKQSAILGTESPIFTRRGYKFLVKWDWVYKNIQETGEE